MAIVAHSHPFVIGVDAHARTHTYAIRDSSTGELLVCEQFPTTPKGLARAIAWAARRTAADAGTLWVIEGIGTYGARLAAGVVAAGYEVAEAPRMNARSRRGIGKSDPIDAGAIAAAVLPLDTSRLRRPRADEGARAGLRVLSTARDQLSQERTMNVNALTALLRVHGLGTDARKPLGASQVREVSRWRDREEALALRIARDEAVRLAKRILELEEALKANEARMTELIRATPAAPLLEETGIGPVTAAIIITAWSHLGRVRDEAAFASLAGVSPIPASSGNTVRHRLNRGGDRRLNRALHTVTMVRMNHHPDTRAYVERRIAEGRSTREIRRCLKRYLARHLYRRLNALHAAPEAA
ncbi:IS110 family transposase [Sinomonas sp. P47F7]|uniref:IS110 family transposase n=1 Tax=Sinomonas sp. P47F7 TaxID=3410987 RepID=UPI003BF5C79E